MPGVKVDIGGQFTASVGNGQSGLKTMVFNHKVVSTRTPAWVRFSGLQDFTW